MLISVIAGTTRYQYRSKYRRLFTFQSQENVVLSNKNLQLFVKVRKHNWSKKILNSTSFI